MERRPKGYVGTHHETIGSDILAILETVHLPSQVLGDAHTARLQQVKKDEWYPISWLLEPLDLIAARVGQFGLRQMGRRLFQLSHEQNVKKRVKSAGDLVFGLDGLYRAANRGQEIGGWNVLHFADGVAELEKTTPHHCVMEEGILAQAFVTLELPALVTQSTCFRRGADSCVFILTSGETGARWMGPHQVKRKAGLPT